MKIQFSLTHKSFALAGALLCCCNALCQTKANYQLAERFRLLEETPIARLTSKVSPTFINNTDCFYYPFTTSEGTPYYYVNKEKS